MLKRVLDQLILNRRREIPFIIFFTFFVTFVITRVIAYSIHLEIVPDFLFFIKTIYINGYHIHHFNFGIILLAMAGYLSLTDVVRTHVRKIAIIYGIGLSLIADEFGLLVTLQKDAYWYRGSYDAIIVTTVILLNIVYFGRFWKVMGGTVKKLCSRQFWRGVFKGRSVN